jgi:hypothetical protein
VSEHAPEPENAPQGDATGTRSGPLKRRSRLLVVFALAAASIGLALRSMPQSADGDETLNRLSDTEFALEWHRAAAEKYEPFTDYEKMRAAGYGSVLDVDMITPGYEHLINWSLVDDDRILDPEEPESLLFGVEPDGTRTLWAYMFMLPPRYTFDDVPNIADGSIPWHMHKGACLAGGTDLDFVCTSKERAPVYLMMHAWVVPHACGPFAATLLSPTSPLWQWRSNIDGTDRNGDPVPCRNDLALRAWPELGATAPSLGRG